MDKKLIYNAVSVERKLPANYEVMLPSKTLFIRTNDTMPPVYKIAVKNAYVSPYGIVFKNGKVINESVYSMFKPYKQYLTFYKKILLNKVKKVSGKVAICHNAYYKNYYHFVADCLPRLYAIKDQAKDLTLVLHEDTTRFITEYVSLFEFKDIVYVKVDELIKADEVIFPTQTSKGLAYNPILLKEISNWIKSKLDIKSSNIPSIKTAFISREFAQYRRTDCDKQIVEYLRSKNVTILNFENVSIKHQIETFDNIENLISIHGAGMVNTMYSDKCKVIIDLIHDKHYDPAFYNLAAVYDTDFYFIQCPGLHSHLNPNVNDLKVDFEKFKLTCEEFIFNKTI